MSEIKDSVVVQTKCDMMKLAELSKLAVGSRTLREFANLSGLSESFLSRLTTGKLKSIPTRRSLAKLTAASSKPQNNITFRDIMLAAGYPLSLAEGSALESPSSKAGCGAVPEEILTAAFPAYLVEVVLEQSRQLSPFYSCEKRKELFVIHNEDGKDIVGIPAFCTSNTIDREIVICKRNLIMALNIYGNESKDMFFLIITNQSRLYEKFDRHRLASTGGEIYIAFTEDLKRFTKQRMVETVDAGGKPNQPVSRRATYQLV